MRLEIQAVDGHFVLFGATVYAAGGYGEAERLGLFLAGREEIFSAKREQRAAIPIPHQWRRRWRG